VDQTPLEYEAKPRKKGFALDDRVMNVGCVTVVLLVLVGFVAFFLYILGNLWSY
jgi:hypothetical protein